MVPLQGDYGLVVRNEVGNDSLHFRVVNVNVLINSVTAIEGNGVQDCDNSSLALFTLQSTNLVRAYPH